MSRFASQRAHRGLLLVLLLLALVVSATVVFARQEAQRQTSASAETLSAHSNLPDGARALRLWLGELGFHTSPLEFRPFRLDTRAQVLFMLAPTEEIRGEHLDEIQRWVNQGGTLIVVPGWDRDWLGSFGLEVVSTTARQVNARRLQPFASPAAGPVPVDTTEQLRLIDPSWVPLLVAPGENDRFVAATRAFGEGRIYTITSETPMSNAGLHDEASAAFILDLLRGIPSGSAVVFDEYHHGYTEYGTLQARMLREPWGWAIFYAGALCLAYLAFAGRRFGSALPSLPRGARRARAEYVTTLAGMLRAGNHRDWLRRQYAAQVRNALCRHFRVPPDLPAAEFVSALSAQHPEAQGLARPLQQLEEHVHDDATLIGLIRQIEPIRARLLGLSPPSPGETRTRAPHSPSENSAQAEMERHSVA